MTVDGLLSSLRARLDQFAVDHDPAILLHPAALADLLALAEELNGQLLAHPEAASVLGLAHLQRYLLLPEPEDREDLVTAVAVFRELVSLRPDLVPDAVLAYLRPEDELHATEGLRGSTAAFADYRSSPLLGRALASYRRYASTGALSDLDEGIDAAEAAVSNPTVDTPRAVGATMLSGLYLVRYRATGRSIDLDRAIDYGRDAISEEKAHDRAARLSNLGLALQARYESAGRRNDLDQAVALHRQAIAFASATDPAFGQHLSNLGLALRLRYESTANSADLDEAVEIARSAVMITAPEHPELFRQLGNLGLVLRERYERDGTHDDLDGAVEAGREAVAILPAGHPGRAGALLNLGGSLLAGATALDDRAMLAEAVHVLREALQFTEEAPAQRALIATHLGRAAAQHGDWNLAVDSLATALRAVDQIVRHGSEFQLARFAGLASDAAACALQTGDTARAAELWEYGHGVLLRHSLELDSKEQADLAMVAPSLAARFAALRASGRGSVHGEWLRTIEQIRALQGFEDFLRPASAETLLAAASAGPIVLLNVSRYRSDAIVLTTNGIEVIRLPGLDPDEVQERYLSFAQVIDTAGQISDLLAWLWDTTAGPVLHHLGFEHGVESQLPRLWWCPAGPLAFLPLHLAGRHDDPKQTVFGLVVSSYTPTVGALINARARSVSSLSDSPRVLAIGVTQAADEVPLALAVREANAVSHRFPSSTVLTDSAATTEAVLAALPDKTWVHFACHGYANPTDPASSGLRLNDRMLTIRDLVDVHVQNARLAFLSACQTATSSTLLADEAVNLATAFQVAGYAHVIANPWRIPDKIAWAISDRFYHELVRGAEDPAVALHAAIREVRARFPEAPLLWTSTIHVGP
ncbi:CHAT domain-containing protein [Micromonospora sp. NPDC047134]|uniref:CHAT domain-containing protein n=1 Tax=Micromonospora sp. NPDC047134 TaxID=3154340 RepID=UPI0033C72CEE